jgi:hypothetical protein
VDKKMRYLYGNYQYSEEQIKAFLNYKQYKDNYKKEFGEYVSNCITIFVMALSYLLPMLY